MQLKPQHSLGRRGFSAPGKRAKKKHGKESEMNFNLSGRMANYYYYLYCFQHLFRSISFAILWRFMRPLI